MDAALAAPTWRDLLAAATGAAVFAAGFLAGAAGFDDEPLLALTVFLRIGRYDFAPASHP